MKNNNPYVSGVPDCWYSAEGGGDMWIEYKFVQRIPVRSLVKVELSALQRQWLSERYKEGRQLAVILGCKEGGVLLNDLEWESDINPNEFHTRLQDRRAIAMNIYSILMEKSDGNSIRTKHLSALRKIPTGN